MQSTQKTKNTAKSEKDTNLDMEDSVEQNLDDTVFTENTNIPEKEKTKQVPKLKKDKANLQVPKINKPKPDKSVKVKANKPSEPDIQENDTDDPMGQSDTQSEPVDVEDEINKARHNNPIARVNPNSLKSIMIAEGKIGEH